MIETASSNPLDKLGTIEASVHTPIYTMHKFWARRSWRVFRRIIEVFTRPGQIILDPFAGGGVTLVEGLILRRKVIAVDLNPLACFIMKHQVSPLDVRKYLEVVKLLRSKLEPLALQLYSIECPRCGSTTMVDWVERDAKTNVALAASLRCGCGFSGEITSGIERFNEEPSIPPSAYPRYRIPLGEKTKDLIRRGYTYFYQLFTPRNLVMLSYLKSAINEIQDPEVREAMMFTFSSTLKWASKMSHRRKSKGGYVVEGWAMHAYWIYPKYLEINVWKQFLNRVQAVVRGKRYFNEKIGTYAKEARDFAQLSRGDATYMIIQGDSRRLPIPDSSVDAVITDPPYGGNVNYAELSDYFLVWQDMLSPKREEIVINPTRGLDLRDYVDGLSQVFKECHRVLKPGSDLVSTFNSTNPEVVGAFVYSLRSAGFEFMGVSYQPYLRAYETTFHAMQVDSMPFDFVFWFKKDVTKRDRTLSFSELKSFLTHELEKSLEGGYSLRSYLSSVYPKLIEFIATTSLDQIMPAVRFLSTLIKENSEEFSKIRKEIVAKRIQRYASGEVIRNESS